MAKARTPREIAPAPPRPVGVWRLAYWCGRIMQMLGLLLMWWVLLLFVGFASMGVLLCWSVVAAVVFYAGWACTVWARKDA